MQTNQKGCGFVICRFIKIGLLDIVVDAGFYVDNFAGGIPLAFW